MSATFNYSGLQDTTIRMLQRFGIPATFTHTENGQYLPSEGRSANSTETNYTAHVVRSNWATSEKAQGDILESDIKLIAEPDNYAKNDTVTIDGALYKIYNFTKISPADDKLVYLIQLRR